MKLFIFMGYDVYDDDDDHDDDDDNDDKTFMTKDDSNRGDRVKLDECF